MDSISRNLGHGRGLEVSSNAWDHTRSSNSKSGPHSVSKGRYELWRFQGSKESEQDRLGQQFECFLFNLTVFKIC